MLFRIDTAGKAAEAVPADSFSDLQFHERYDIQEWILNNPELLGEPLLVIATEFSGFDKTSERLDVLALDKRGKLVVIELKRTAIGTAADLQALRYAAYCSTLKLTDAADLRAKHCSRRAAKTSEEEALEQIRDFVDDPELEELDDKPRIILAADAFGDEMTATVLWLRSFEMDIRCVRLTPYVLEGHLVVDSSILIPLPDAEDFVIRRERKEASRSSSRSSRRPTLEEFLARVPEEVRPYLVRMRKALVNHPDVKETVFNNLISYRRQSDNGWITWLAHTAKQARFALPEDYEVPESLIAKSGDGWITLRVSSERELELALKLIQERFSKIAAGQELSSSM